MDIDRIAANLVVLLPAMEAAAKRDDLQVHGYFTGQYDAYRQVFGDAHNWSFPEEMNLQEAAAESLTKFKPEVLKSIFENVIRITGSAEYVRLYEPHPGEFWPGQAPQPWVIDADSDEPAPAPSWIPSEDTGHILSSLYTSRAMGCVGAKAVVDRPGRRAAYKITREGQTAIYNVTPEA